MKGVTVSRKLFQSPCPDGYNNGNEQLALCLWACKQFVPWGSSGPVLLAINNWLDTTKPVEKDEEVESVTLPPGIYPLLLWLSEESEDESSTITIAVDPLLVCFCQRHQRYC
ncbi:hypothetical protein SLEP1_g59035 [Rubroshorea leprosula]|uniref:Uncharacterized protein n=1 Tax=Rubroshorea leprosula TaxID=152421 RepID=A0AAV5MUE6_9ROSI|nr:hypothetical protein SLEP1_g59035 [Rubroshorea leprosula]